MTFRDIARHGRGKSIAEIKLPVPTDGGLPLRSRPNRCNAPREYGPMKTLYNRWKRWSGMGFFARIMEGCSSKAAERKTIMIDATYLKAHRTASSLRVKKGGARTGYRAHKRRIEHQAQCPCRFQRTALEVLHGRRRGQPLLGYCGPIVPDAEGRRDHVRQAQGLASHRNPIRKMPNRLVLRHWPRSLRFVLATKADEAGP